MKKNKNMKEKKKWNLFLKEWRKLIKWKNTTKNKWGKSTSSRRNKREKTSNVG